MRRAIENWFGEHGTPLPRPTRRYEDGAEETPLIADDADVSAIAAHAARLAIDALIAREPSLFPNSVYAIGLGVGSVFNQPFETFPIEVGSPPEAEPQEQLSPDENAAEIGKILELLKALTDETAADPKTDQTHQA